MVPQSSTIEAWDANVIPPSEQHGEPSEEPACFAAMRSTLARISSMMFTAVPAKMGLSTVKKRHKIR